jgi:hypothetical protein
MKMVKTRRAVRNISRKTPLAIDVPGLSVVETFNGPGSRAEMTAALHILARIWERKQRSARVAVREPTSQTPKVTCVEGGLG